MLTYRLLKNHAGMVLIGDYSSLDALHWVIHDVNDNSALLRNPKSKWFLGLAYDVRKALERERLSIPPNEGFEDTGTHFGVGILWPHILIQSRILRTGLGFMASKNIHQAMTYTLEHVIEEAIKDAFGRTADRIIARWKSINPAHPCVESVFRSRGHLFCEWNDAERRLMLDSLLATFDPLYEFDQEMSVKYKGNHSAMINPQQFEGRDGEWPDPHAGDDLVPMMEMRISLEPT